MYSPGSDPVEFLRFSPLRRGRIKATQYGLGWPAGLGGQGGWLGRGSWGGWPGKARRPAGWVLKVK